MVASFHRGQIHRPLQNVEPLSLPSHLGLSPPSLCSGLHLCALFQPLLMDLWGFQAGLLALDGSVYPHFSYPQLGHLSQPSWWTRKP